MDDAEKPDRRGSEECDEVVQRRRDKVMSTIAQSERRRC